VRKMEQLPQCLVHLIAFFLEDKELGVVLRVSRSIHSVLEQSFFWRLRAQVNFPGLGPKVFSPLRVPGLESKRAYVITACKMPRAVAVPEFCQELLQSPCWSPGPYDEFLKRMNFGYEQEEEGGHHSEHGNDSEEESEYYVSDQDVEFGEELENHFGQLEGVDVPGEDGVEEQEPDVAQVSAQGSQEASETMESDGSGAESVGEPSDVSEEDSEDWQSDQNPLGGFFEQTHHSQYRRILLDHLGIQILPGNPLDFAEMIVRSPACNGIEWTAVQEFVDQKTEDSTLSLVSGVFDSAVQLCKRGRQGLFPSSDVTRIKKYKLSTHLLFGGCEGEYCQDFVFCASRRLVRPPAIPCAGMHCVSYFEVKIIHVSTAIGVGLCDPLQTPLYFPNTFLGWKQGSFGYHSDDGCKFHASGQGTPFGPRFGNGDIVGCGLDWTNREIFYTLNGSFVGTAFHALNTDLEAFFPAVSLTDVQGRSSESVSFNFGLQPFSFSMTSYLDLKRRQV